MLQQMRKFAKSWVSSIFLGALALSFGVWGIADIFTGASNTAVAEVGNVKIPQDIYQRQYQNILRQQTQRTGKALSPDEAQALGIPQGVLQSLIDDTALNTVVNDHGLVVSDKTVAEEIRQFPAFVGPSGGFDHQTFLAAIQRSDYTEQGFIEMIRSEMTRDQFTSATKDGLQMPKGYAKALFDYVNEVRGARYVAIPATAAGTVAKPDDAALQAYVKAHAKRFSTPEYRELTYAAVTPDDVMSEISVTDKRLKDQYELQETKYKIPEKRDVEQITFQNEAEAKAASEQIAKGASFEDIATKRGLKPSDLKLGELQEADLGGERGKAAFAVAEGGVTKPVKSTFGWVILKVTKIVPGVNRTFDQVKDELRQEVIKRLALDKISEIGNKFEDAMAGGDTLSEAAKKSGMKVVHVKAVDKTGLAADGSKADVPADKTFLDQVFAADVGVAGDPFQLPDGSAYAMKVDGVTPPKLKPLDQVRDKAEAEWTQEQQQKALAKKVEALAAQANKAQDLAPVAEAVKGIIEQSPGMQRGTPVAPFPAALMDKIFDAPPGAVVYGKADKGGGYIIARVTGIAHPPASIMRDPRYKQFLANVSGQVGNDIPEIVAKDARKRQGVTINQKVVDSVAGTGS